MEQERGTVTNTLKKEVEWLKFAIQANNPKCTMVYDKDDYDLSTAIETVFTILTEDAILIWNHIYVPLSYKYDVSCMINDILEMLKNIRNESQGRMLIMWPSNTFKCAWNIKWSDDKIHIVADWENVVGNTKNILTSNNTVVTQKTVFVYEWKKLLYNIIESLTKCGYDENLNGMNELKREFDLLENFGILYQ